MTISRLDLDGLGSPAAIAGRILQLESDLPLIIPLDDLCSRLDIGSIEKIDTQAFEAALIMDVNKAAGAILLARNRSSQRTRYSLAHELGHWLIPTHRPDAAHGFECQLDDLHRVDEKEQNRRRRIEAEANRFASALLMPPRRVRSQMGGTPDLGDIVALTAQFGVSKEAMARAYVDASRETLAVLILHRGLIKRMYRNSDFPWISVRIGNRVSPNSVASVSQPAGSMSDLEECDPAIWLSDRDASRTELLLEQVLGQANEFAMVMLHAEISDAEEA
jgi:Zn-dependent peptidase ImmA (M78 family)